MTMPFSDTVFYFGVGAFLGIRRGLKLQQQPFEGAETLVPTGLFIYIRFVRGDLDRALATVAGYTLGMLAVNYLVILAQAQQIPQLSHPEL